MKRENIIVLDFGGQYKQLIARRVRECHVYCEIHPHTMPVEELKKKKPKGIIVIKKFFTSAYRCWESATAPS